MLVGYKHAWVYFTCAKSYIATDLKESRPSEELDFKFWNQSK